MRFVAYDGNGNVSALCQRRRRDGVAPSYEYGPFGEVIRATGPMAKANPFRFSTKYQDDETDLLYYGYRYYNASTGRWVSRDPIGDSVVLRDQIAAKPDIGDRLIAESLLPPYHFTKNDPISRVDSTGLDAAVTWNPAPSTCPNGQTIAFVQVGYGGWGPYSAPFVDDGSKGFGAHGTGCPEYPNFGRPGNFEDTPGGLTGPVKFITCEVCKRSCCTRRGPGTEITIVACKSWKKGDTGPLGQAGAFPNATAAQITMLKHALSAKYPDWRACYKYQCKQ